MNSCTQGFDDLHRRLLKLENQNRRFKRLGVAALILPVLMLLMGQTSTRKTIEANEFILKDGDGHVRSRLRMAGDFFSVPELDLIDEKGTIRLQLRGGFDHVGGPANFSGISLFDENKRERGSFDADEHGAALAFLDVKGTDDGLVRADGIMVTGPLTVSDERGFQAIVEQPILSRRGAAQHTEHPRLPSYSLTRKKM